jgi:hypothetical protein
VRADDSQIENAENQQTGYQEQGGVNQQRRKLKAGFLAIVSMLETDNETFWYLKFFIHNDMEQLLGIG